MKIRTLAVAAAAMSLASAPAVAEISLDRSAAPVEGESEIGAAAGVLGALALAGVIFAVIEATDDEEPLSATGRCKAATESGPSR